MESKNKSNQYLNTDDPEPSLHGIVRIYSTRFCPYCERVLIAAHKKNIPFDVLYTNPHKRPKWFFLKNPEGIVPALEHNGRLINDSRVIIEYLDEAFPERNILSNEPYVRAKQRYYTTKLEPICETIKQMSYLTKLVDNTTILATKLAAAENLLQSPFYSGEVPSLPDIMLFPFIHRLHVIRKFGRNNFLDNYFPNNYPKLVKWFITMRNTPEIQAVQESEKYLKDFLSGINSKTNQNATNFNAEIKSDSNPLHH
ncbi:unnamed protein product [Cercopithifilaria johnstoni]|uniref:Glutathione S-transferase omega n=1 Tax=Cercopithifilaria johnstoni TaxID=2874296 RepID=A0A8J2MIK6_9BILA|nr:unnamed protein product [Cercopithifilaria johnstoni]